MIIGIGTDMVSHVLTKELKWRSDPHTRVRVFSKRELELYEQDRNIRFLAGRFAAKEAIVKCFGTGMLDGVSLLDIEILKSKRGQPVVVLKGAVKKLALKLGINGWHLTISHCRGYSLAFAVAEQS